MNTLLSSRHDHVVDIGVRRELPFPAQRIETDPLSLLYAKPRIFELGSKLVRANKTIPVMRPGRQPTEHIFRSDLGERQAFQSSVQRRDDHEAARCQKRSARCKKCRNVAHMLYDFHVEDEIERGPFARQRFSRCRAIGKRQP